jgi:hypothetical protein
VFAAPSVDDDGLTEGLQLLLHVIGDKESAAQPVMRLPSAAGAGMDVEDELKAGPILFMLPGVEGLACVLEPLARNLLYQTICLQPDYSTVGQTLQDMTRSLLPVRGAHLLSDPFIANSGHLHRKFELVLKYTIHI